MLGFGAARSRCALLATGREAPHFPFAELPLHVLLLQNWGFTDRAGVERPRLVDLVRARRLSAVPAARRSRSTGAACRPSRCSPRSPRCWCCSTPSSRCAARRRSATTSRASALIRCVLEFACGTAICALWLRWRETWHVARHRLHRGGVALLLAGWIAGPLPETLAVPAAFAALLLALALTSGMRGQPARRPRRSIISARSATRPISAISCCWFAFKLALRQRPPRGPPPLIALYLALVLASSVGALSLGRAARAAMDERPDPQAAAASATCRRWLTARLKAGMSRLAAGSGTKRCSAHSTRQARRPDDAHAIVYVDDQRTRNHPAQGAPRLGLLGPERQAHHRSRRDRPAERGSACPPLIRDAWFCPDPNGHIQAIGWDDKGRKQYRYHTGFREAQEAAKYDRCAALRPAPSQAARAASRPISSYAGYARRRRSPRSSACSISARSASATRPMRRTNKSFGATTLRKRHAKVKGQTLKLQFRAKSGKLRVMTITDGSLSRLRQDGARTCPASICSAGSTMPARRIRSPRPTSTPISARRWTDDFTAKHFRTWGASVHRVRGAGLRR